jgi:hypothetical protein
MALKNKKWILDKKEYGGKYVATKSFTDTDIIASGKDPIEVFHRAVEKGFINPVIDYVPKEGVVCIY